MKKFLTLSMLSILFFFGCNQDSEIIAPVEEPSNQEYTLISLPAPTGGLSIETIYSFSMEISGDSGGTFFNYFSYAGGQYGEVWVVSSLVFPANSFSGYEDITKTYNTDFATMEYGPSMSFNEPVLCNLLYYGLDLTGINPETVRFVYIRNDGTIEDCEYETLTVNVASGLLYVTNAQINHFSRYGFVN